MILLHEYFEQFECNFSGNSLKRQLARVTMIIGDLSQFRSHRKMRPESVSICKSMVKPNEAIFGVDLGNDCGGDRGIVYLFMFGLQKNKMIKLLITCCTQVIQGCRHGFGNIDKVFCGHSFITDFKLGPLSS